VGVGGLGAGVGQAAGRLGWTGRPAEATTGRPRPAGPTNAHQRHAADFWRTDHTVMLPKCGDFKSSLLQRGSRKSPGPSIPSALQACTIDEAEQLAERAGRTVRVDGSARCALLPPPTIRITPHRCELLDAIDRGEVHGNTDGTYVRYGVAASGALGALAPCVPSSTPAWSMTPLR